METRAIHLRRRPTDLREGSRMNPDGELHARDFPTDAGIRIYREPVFNRRNDRPVVRRNEMTVCVKFECFVERTFTGRGRVTDNCHRHGVGFSRLARDRFRKLPE
jgi:hypothetical protein